VDSRARSWRSFPMNHLQGLIKVLVCQRCRIKSLSCCFSARSISHPGDAATVVLTGELAAGAVAGMVESIHGRSRKMIAWH
jgi:hypothetical protein